MKILIFFMFLFPTGLLASGKPMPLSNLGVKMKEPVKTSALIWAEEVNMDGVNHYRLHVGKVSFVIPDLLNYTQSDFEEAFCGTGKYKDKKIASSKIKVTRSFSVYAQIVRNMVDNNPCLSRPEENSSVKRLNRHQTANQLNPALEIGVQLDDSDDDKKNTLKAKRVFLNPWNKSLGFGADF